MAKEAGPASAASAGRSPRSRCRTCKMQTPSLGRRHCTLRCPPSQPSTCSSRESYALRRAGRSARPVRPGRRRRAGSPPQRSSASRPSTESATAQLNAPCLLHPCEWPGDRHTSTKGGGEHGEAQLMREAELSPTCEYPLSRLPPVFLNRCGWVSYRFGVGFLSDTYPVVSDVSIVYPDVSQMYLIFLLVLSEEDTCILSSNTSKCIAVFLHVSPSHRYICDTCHETCILSASFVPLDTYQDTSGYTWIHASWFPGLFIATSRYMYINQGTSDPTNWLGPPEVRWGDLKEMPIAGVGFDKCGSRTWTCGGTRYTAIHGKCKHVLGLLMPMRLMLVPTCCVCRGLSGRCSSCDLIDSGLHTHHSTV